MLCPLCRFGSCSFFFRDNEREYFQCPVCHLVFVHPGYHVSADEEKERYDLHRNDPGDQGYRDFLLQLFLPVRQCLKAGDRGLEFGSGPVPVLAAMFRDEGFDIKIFDPFYADNSEALSGQYDFITASEVVEHLRNPLDELDRLYRLLKPGGILGIMTGMSKGLEEFGEWFYKNDKTHICFFSPRTFSWIAGKWGAEIVYASGNVVILRKSGYGQIIPGNPSFCNS